MIESGTASAQPEQRWIPCSERLPEESGRYLISALDGIGRRTTVAPYQPRYKAWTMTGRMAYWKVVAWQPLPEPLGNPCHGCNDYDQQTQTCMSDGGCAASNEKEEE